MLINKTIKNWFNGTPIYNSERDDKEYTKRQNIHLLFFFYQTCILQMTIFRIPAYFTFYLKGISEY